MDVTFKFHILCHAVYLPVIVEWINKSLRFNDVFSVFQFYNKKWIDVCTYTGVECCQFDEYHSKDTEHDIPPKHIIPTLGQPL